MADAVMLTADRSEDGFAVNWRLEFDTESDSDYWIEKHVPEELEWAIQVFDEMRDYGYVRDYVSLRQLCRAQTQVSMALSRKIKDRLLKLEDELIFSRTANSNS